MSTRKRTSHYAAERGLEVARQQEIQRQNAFRFREMARLALYQRLSLERLPERLKAAVPPDGIVKWQKTKLPAWIVNHTGGGMVWDGGWSLGSGPARQVKLPSRYIAVSIDSVYWRNGEGLNQHGRFVPDERFEIPELPGLPYTAPSEVPILNNGPDRVLRQAYKDMDELYGRVSWEGVKSAITVSKAIRPMGKLLR